MRMYDLIEAKKLGKELSQSEIAFMVKGCTKEEIPDYQLSALLMAIYFKGMTNQETVYLTEAMAHSGDMADLSEIQGFKVDKHSTGGVGDKTTLILGPIVASLGVKVAKMSGRGLGHTGGTIDKLESIPGVRTSMTMEEFISIVNNTGIAVIGQTGNLVPADKKLYALRDVTATVDSIPLISSSIMSKKLAAGSDGIMLDIKVGSGAFMKTIEDAVSLAETMVAIGIGAGRKCSGMITNMDVPLGNAIGNSLEVIEAVQILNNKGPEDLKVLCLTLASYMLEMAGKGTIKECRKMAEDVLENGSALHCFMNMVKAQGGDVSYIWNTDKFPKSPFAICVNAKKSGYITHINTEACGLASVLLGAGRSQKEDHIDYSAGIYLNKKYGDYVEKGDAIATLYTSAEDSLKEAKLQVLSAYTIDLDKPKENSLIYASVTKDGVDRLICNNCQWNR